MTDRIHNEKKEVMNDEKDQDDGNVSNGKEEEEDDDDDGWIKLMGGDLILKNMGPISNLDSSFDSYNASNDDENYAEMGDFVTVEYMGRSLSSFSTKLSKYPIQPYFKTNKSIMMEENEIFTKISNYYVTLGDADVIPALEMAIRFIPIHHYGIIRTKSKFAYGLLGFQNNVTDEKTNHINSHNHPPETPAEFHVLVKANLSSNSEEFLSANVTLKRADAKKRMGNDVFKYEGNNVRALKLYQSSARLMDTFIESLRNSDDVNDRALQLKDISEKKQIEKQAIGVLIDCLNNSALVHFQMGEYGKSKEIATSVIADWDSDNTKALCRAAKAAMMDSNGTFEEAKAAIDAAMDIMGKENKEVRRLLLEWKKRKKEHKIKEKELYTKMLGNNNHKAENDSELATSGEKNDEILQDTQINKKVGQDVVSVIKDTIIHLGYIGFIAILVSILLKAYQNSNKQ